MKTQSFGLDPGNRFLIFQNQNQNHLDLKNSKSDFLVENFPVKQREGVRITIVRPATYRRQHLNRASFDELRHFDGNFLRPKRELIMLIKNSDRTPIIRVMKPNFDCSPAHSPLRSPNLGLHGPQRLTESVSQPTIHTLNFTGQVGFKFWSTLLATLKLSVA